MKILAIFAALLSSATMSSVALAAAPGVDIVVSSCQVVAASASSDPNASQGECLAATEGLLSSLGTSSLGAAEQDEAIVDLVYALVPLTQEDQVCNGFDAEVAQAIKLASSAVSTPEQAAQLVQIGDTVAACTCEQPETAALDASLPPFDFASAPAGLGEVVQRCEQVAAMETPDGSCIASTGGFLENLKVQPVPAPDLDQSVTDTVLALVPLIQGNRECSRFNDEVARAINLAATYASTPEQQEQVSQISDTIAACACDGTGAFQTGAIPSPTGPAQ